MREEEKCKKRIQSQKKMVSNAGYWVGHRYLVSGICCFGIFANVLNIIVWSKLCRKDRDRPMHILFLWLSVIDLLVISIYAIFDVYFFWITGPVKEIYHSEFGMYLVLVCYTLYVVFYTASKWMTVALSIFRAIILFLPDHKDKWCSSCRAHIAATGVLVGAVVVWGTPIYMYYTVHEMSNSTNGSTSYWLAKKEIAQTNQSYKQGVLWVYGIIDEIIPVILLSFLSFKFIVKLRQDQGQDQDCEQNSLIEHSDGTRFTVLLAILALFYIIAGLVMGIYALYPVFRKSTDTELYYFMNDASINNFINSFELFNCSITFVFYVAMYPDIKKEARSLFRRNFVDEQNNESVNGYEHVQLSDPQVNVSNVSRSIEKMF